MASNRIEELKKLGEQLGWGPKEFAEFLKELPEEMGVEMPATTQDEGKKPNLEVRISDLITEIGITAHIKGYRYLKSGIEYVVQNPDAINTVTKELYPAIAKEHGTTASRVERAIRHAIEVAWDRGDIDVLQKYFGYTVSNIKGKPTNSEFIARIAEIINLGKDLK